MATTEMFGYRYGYVLLVFLKLMLALVYILRTVEEIQNSRIQVFTMQNFTTGFPKKAFIEGYSILPQHRLSRQPNHTFFSNWSISRQGIKRLSLLPCRQRSVKQNKEGEKVWRSSNRNVSRQA